MPGLALADAGPVLERLAPALLLSDVDGTLVGRDGSLLADLDGKPTLVAAEALVAAQVAGLEVVLVSGRTAAQLRETGRLLGTRDAIAELGTVLVRGREEELVWGDAPQTSSDSRPRTSTVPSSALAAWVPSSRPVSRSWAAVRPETSTTSSPARCAATRASAAARVGLPSRSASSDPSRPTRVPSTSESSRAGASRSITGPAPARPRPGTQAVAGDGVGPPPPGVVGGPPRRPAGGDA